MAKKLLSSFIAVFWIFIFGQGVAYGQCPSSVSFSSSEGNTICQGTAVTFTANANGGTGTLTYQWQINNQVVHSDKVYTTSSLANGDKIKVIVIKSDDTSCSTSSSVLTMTVNTQQTPTVSLSASPSTKCIGKDVTFTASNTNGGPSPIYDFYVNGNSSPSQSSSSKTFTTNSLNEGSNTVRVMMTSSLDCTTSPTAENSINVTITPDASISSPSNKEQTDICINSAIAPIVFTIGGSGNGATVSGLPAGVTGSFSGGNFTISGTPTSAGSFPYTVTATGPCESVTETGIITVVKDATISLTSGNNTQSVCQGEDIAAITYAIGQTGTNGAVSGLPSGIQGSYSNGVFSISGSSNSVGTFDYTVKATGNCGDSEELAGSITINENLVPAVSILSDDADNTICAETPVTFTATATNGGTSPSFQWKINGNNAGTNSNTFTTSVLTDGQSVTVELTSSETCVTTPLATSNAITTSVNPNLTPDVTIEVTDSDICSGDTVQFTATPVNGGTSPSYQWKIDNSVVGTDSPTFSTSSLTDGQQVSVTMTSSETCLASESATSTPIVMQVNPNLTPEVSIRSNDDNNIICAGGTITFTATAVNGGTTPSYQWLVNGVSAGTNSATFTTSSLNDGDTVKVVMTSNEECLAQATTESNEIQIQVDQSISTATPAFDYSNSSHNSTAICPAASGLIYSITPIPGATSYIWTFPNSGWTVTSGADSNQVTVTAGTSAQGGNITVRGVNECGQSQAASITVTTGTAAYVSAGPDQTVCAGTTSIQLAGEIGGVINQGKDFSWSASVDGGSFSDQGGNNTSKKLNPIYTIPPSIRNGGTVTITITSVSPSGTCPEPKKDEMVLTVLKNATISTPSNKDQTVCINSGITQIDFNITDAGTGATVSGLPQGLSGTYASGVFTISGTPAETGTFNYQVNTTGNCTIQQTSITGIIIVTPDQVIGDPTNKSQSLCINQSIDDIVFTTNESVTNVTYSGLPNGLTGILSTDSFTISGTPTEAGTFDYTVTTSGNCESTSQSGTITVKPDPTISDPANKVQEICINTPINAVEFSVTEPGSGASATGLPQGVTGTFANGVFTLSGSPSEAGTFDYSITTTGECVQATQTGQFIVNPDPTAEISYSGDLCQSQTGLAEVTLTGTGAYTGGTFTVSPSGLNIDAATGAIDPALSTPGNYTVSYSTPQGCKTATATADITIHAVPSVELSYTTPICNSGTTALGPTFTNGVGAYENGVFSANKSGLAIDPSTGVINAVNSSPGDYVITYAIPAANGCEAVSTTASISITQIPQFDISYAGPFCTSEANLMPVNFTSTKGEYTGGTFTGSTGLSIGENGNIDPSNSTPGNHTVTYKLAAADGCAAVEATTSFSIYEKVEITTQPVNTGVCSSNPAGFEVVASGDNLSYQWYKNVNGTFTKINGETGPALNFTNATAVNAGEYQVVVGSTNSACAAVTSNTVTLNVDEDIVIVKPAEDITICEDDYQTLSFAYEAHANGAPLTFQWIKDGAPISETTDKYVMTQTGPSNSAEGTYTGTLTIQNIDTSDDGVYAVEIDGPEYFTCSEATSKTFTFRVNPRPDKPETSAVNYCLGATPEALSATKSSSDNELLWYSYDTGTGEYTYLGTSITPTTDVPGETTYWVTQKQPNGCESDPEQLIVTVQDKPEPIATETIQFNYCHNEEVTDPLSVTPSEGSTINWYASQNATTALSSAPVPNTGEVKLTSYWVSQTLTSTGCESERTQVDIDINPLPNIIAEIASGYSSEICLGSETRLMASGATNYIWTYEGAEVGNTAEISVTPESPGSFTYEVVGIDANGCTNNTQITIEVEEPTQGGNASGPESVCVTANQGTVLLENQLGEILNWQYSEDGIAWNNIETTAGLTELQFENLTTTTHYRAVIKNGVCDEVFSTEHEVIVDPVPVAEELKLLFKGTDRVFMMCELPTNDYLVPLQTVGTYTGQIVAWQYRRNSGTEWVTIMEGSEPFTGTALTGQQVINASNNESTIFRVEVQSGACTPNVYSQTATLSIIPSDIAPNPVTASPGEICLGDIVTLSAGTGYGGNGVFEGGAFDNSSIANHGWRVMRYPGSTEYTFESAADNVRPDRWMRTNPHDYIMANPDGSGTVYQRFDSSSGDEGNKGFAIVSGNNPSTLETPVFNTFAMDNPTLTFDQAYNLTPGDTIKVQISLDGGNTYVDEPLFVMGGPAVSGNYASFGDGTPETRPLNKMSIDISKYAGLSNLRIRWLYDGSTGGIYTIDDIGVPQDPDNVQLIWYYDDDLNDPNNELDQIGDVNQNTVTYTPTKIGWNYFEVQTALVFDTNGDPCQSAENMATIQVFVFDTYTTSATAEIGSCGTSSVPLTGVMEGAAQGVITEFPAEDASTVAWEVINSPEGYTFSEAHFDPSITDPNAVFDPGMGGEFTLQWTITPDEDSPCAPTQTPVQFEIQDCTTLDFDGVDDYVDLGTSYTGAYTIEAWIRPFDRPIAGTDQMTNASTGTIISGPSYEVNMSELPAAVVPGTRWYHIAITPDRKLYVDGILISGASLSGGHGKQGTFIGANNNSSGEMINHFSGWIEEVRIWNKGLTQNQIRFMMNQRLINNGAEMGEQIPMPVPEGLTYSDLAGYYRLISKDPDPANLVSFEATLMPSFGETPDLAINPVPGRLYNMTTNQQNTAPLPYFSAIDGQTWETDDTWLRPDVWDPPNSTGVTEDPIDWNIAITRHHIDSGNKDITLLGLKSEIESKLITMANPSGSMDETNSGQLMRVTHYLLLNGNMDLVGESQLLQDEGSILAEESAGWLERDQQGKMLSFNYNYWSSPVSAQGAANNADYSVSQVLLDGTNSASPQTIKYDDRYHIADNGKTTPITISNYWIWKFLGTADIYEEWFHIGSTGTLATGEGYTMKGTDGTVGINDQQNYVFKGKPHNGDFTRAVSQNQNYLVGNPYPSAIDAKEFILDNMKNVTGGRNTSNIFNGAIYYWDHFAGRTHYLERYIGGYATWTLAGGVVAISNDERINANDQEGTKAPGQYVPVAQGFFVNTVLDSAITAATGISVSGGPIEFKNRQRIYKREFEKDDDDPISVFHTQEKKDAKASTSQTTSKQASEDNRQKIWLKFKSPMGYHRQLLVTADPTTSSGFDLGYDAPMIEDNAEDMYWYFSNYEFVIQAVEDFNVDRELDLGMKVHEEGEITISIDELKNIPDDLEIFLKDSLLQVNHDLRKTAYKATSDTGTFHNRFKVIFKDPTAVVVEEPEVEVPEEGEFEILYVTGSREILVKNPELVNIERIYLNNMLGQQLHVYYDIPAEKEVRLPVKRFSSGVYIVKVHSEKGIRTKKVILE